MQIEQLEYIVLVNKHGTFSKAAQELYISQSAVSQSVNRLEKKLGIKLFERSHNGVTATEHGQHLIQIASNILSKITEFELTANNYRDNIQKELRLGLVTGLYLPFLAKTLSHLNNEFPHLKISVHEKSSFEIIDAIINGEMDLGLLVIYTKTLKYQNVISFKKLHPVQLFVFVNKSSPLAQYQVLEPADLKDQMFVMFNAEFMNWVFTNFNELYGSFNLLFTSNNSDTISKAVLDNVAITIETQSEALTNSHVLNGDIIAIPLNSKIQEDSYLGFATLKNKDYPLETIRTTKYLENEIDILYKEGSKLL